MLKIIPIRIILVMLVCGAPAIAQTSSELEQAYGRQSTNYVARPGFIVRPGIVMTVSFTADGQACEMVIEPQRVSASGFDPNKLIPAEVAAEVIDEVVPSAKRGARVKRGPRDRGRGAITFRSGCNEVSSEEYERVTAYVTKTCPGGIRGVDKVAVRWKRRQCR